MKRFIYSIFFLVVYVLYLVPNIMLDHHENCFHAESSCHSKHKHSSCSSSKISCELNSNNDFTCSHQNHYQKEKDSCLLCDHNLICDHLINHISELNNNIFFLDSFRDLYFNIPIKDLNNFRNKSPPHYII